MNPTKSLVLALVAVAATVFFVWHGQTPVTTVQATWEDVITEGKVGGYSIITTEELISRYKDEYSKLLIVDTRQEWEYRTGHIAGAVNFPMEPTWWSRLRNAGKLEEFLGSDKDRDIVFY